MEPEKVKTPEATDTGGSDSSDRKEREDGRQPEEDHLWVANSLSLPRETAFVFVVCMSQFCTRKCWPCIHSTLDYF